MTVIDNILKDKFLTDGYIYGNVPIVKNINFDQYNFDDCNYDDCALDNKLTPILLKVNQYLIDNYVNFLFLKYEVLNMNAWCGVDDLSANWHNDLAEGFNSNILVYLDCSLNKNSIEISNGFSEIKIYPNKGDFVWLNQSKKFLHRATHIEGNRRVLSFEFNIKDLYELN
jgi:hypothetical protein